jgi:hypothetical protein
MKLVSFKNIYDDKAGQVDLMKVSRVWILLFDQHYLVIVKIIDSFDKCVPAFKFGCQ